MFGAPFEEMREYWGDHGEKWFQDRERGFAGCARPWPCPSRTLAQSRGHVSHAGGAGRGCLPVRSHGEARHRGQARGTWPRERRALAAVKLAGQPGVCSWAATCSQC